MARPAEGASIPVDREPAPEGPETDEPSGPPAADHTDPTPDQIAKDVADDIAGGDTAPEPHHASLAPPEEPATHPSTYLAPED